MMDIFSVLLYQPLYNVLVILFNAFPWGGVGLAVILITVLIKIALLPFNYKTLKSQKEMQEIQPKINEIRQTYKDDQAKMAQELMAVYKTHKVNPFASCLPMVVQLIVLLVFYQVLRAGIQTIDQNMLYAFVHNPGSLSHMFLGIDLSRVSVTLAAVAAVAQFFQAKQMITSRPPAAVREKSETLDEDMMAVTNKTMVYMLPVVIFIVGATSVPGGLTLYMLVSTVMTYIMYAVFLGKKKEAPSNLQT
jgi:YidC/Oxa1 family membrane protein insertase